MRIKLPGFTIVEVAIWITILGLIFGIVVRGAFKKPPLNHFPYLIRELNNATFFAQQKAIANGKIIKLLITPQNPGGYLVELFELSTLSEKRNESEPEINFVPSKSVFSPVNNSVDSIINLMLVDKNIKAESEMTEKNIFKKNGEISSFFFPSGFCEELNIKLSKYEMGFVVEEKISLNSFSCQFETEEEGAVFE